MGSGKKIDKNEKNKVMGVIEVREYKYWADQQVFSKMFVLVKFDYVNMFELRAIQGNGRAH